MLSRDRCNKNKFVGLPTPYVWPLRVDNLAAEGREIISFIKLQRRSGATSIILRVESLPSDIRAALLDGSHRECLEADGEAMHCVLH